ncbi:MAG: type I glyceraldehyde-3-phosphate dehydrogenase [Deltaproteobacteria bacterium]|jgi:glyceraldehyde 3-phosphate dehydrogenase|nr:type I glyceraldehyde-3-phosphate dehydrogenase [Deltaproteobacteria bacterium]
MTTFVGISGFGRIGRLALKTTMERYPDQIKVVAINGRYDIQTNAHLLKHDSNFGHFGGTVEIKDDFLIINGLPVKNTSIKETKDIPWKDFGVDLVLECAGTLNDATKARAHIDGGGAKKVIITAPSKNEDITIVMGVNHKDYDPKKHHVISNASCTTNCMAPPAYIINKAFGIDRGMMNTIHAYTNDQVILDLPHRDLRRARAAALNIIPTTTGAAKALSLVIPELKDKFEGISLRVPTPTVSLADFTATLHKNTTTEELLGVLKEACEGPLKGIMYYDTEGLVSVDYKGNPYSSIIDAPFCQVIGGNMCKVLAWYDNEYSYSCRVSDLAYYMATKGF